jgi:hypothetical protein
MMQTLREQQASLLETKKKIQATFERGECPTSL